jgi:transposase
MLKLVSAVATYNAQIKHLSEQSDVCKRLMTGLMVATALVAAVSDGQAFKSGREMSAWLGLVPGQHSTGGKPRLLSISNLGDVYRPRS